MRKIMNGGYYPWAPKSGAGYVDIDDVAAAHTLAMLTPRASGRCAPVLLQGVFRTCFWPQRSRLRPNTQFRSGKV